MLDDNWPLVLLALRVGVAIALYLFLLTAVRALRAEVRARTMPFITQTATVTRTASHDPGREPARARDAFEPPVEVVPRRAGDRLEVVAYDGEESALADALTGRSYALDGEPVLIGRGSGNTIVLPERHVSARHARLVPEDGAWWVEDLGSTNGTYVGRHRVSGRARLDPSMEVRFGPVVARLVRNGSR
ncbi:MAG: FHA domain-containing protein [Chloroflexi bacterium]|nr:FHA domain-containing protein [Chloroflexota bacterium]